MCMENNILKTHNQETSQPIENKQKYKIITKNQKKHLQNEQKENILTIENEKFII